MPHTRVAQTSIMTVALALAILVVLAGPAPAAGTTVTVEGVAATRDGALDRALRDAVRQGAGVDIDSVTSLVASEDAEEFREQTVSAATGAVESFRILAAGVDAGMWRVRVEATVSRKQASRPTDVVVSDAKVVVITRGILESTDADVDDGGEALGQTLREELVKRHFDVRVAVFDKAKVFDPARDLLQMDIDPLQTDLVIFAEARTSVPRTKEFKEYGMTRHTARTKVTVSAIRPDNLKVMATRSSSSEVTGRDLAKALEGAVERALDRLSLDFVDDLVKQLVWERNNGAIMSFHLAGADLPADDLVRFVSMVSALPGMIKVLPRVRTRDRTLVDALTYLGRSATMQTVQPILAELNLEVTGFQGQSMVFGPYRGKKSRIWADSIPQGADVLVDMAQLGTTPLMAEVETGQHQIRFRCLGFHDAAQTAEAPRGRVLRVMAELAKTPDVAPTTAFVKLVSTPTGATVRNAKDQVLGTTPLARLELPVGPQILSVDLDGYGREKLTVTAEAGKTAAYEVKLAKLVDFVQRFRDRKAEGTTDALMAKARDQRNDKKYAEAVVTLKRVLEFDPKAVEAYRLMGEIHEYDLNDLESALMDYNDYYFNYREVVPEAERSKRDTDTIREAMVRVRTKIEERRKKGK